MITASHALQKSIEMAKPETEAPVAQQRTMEESPDDFVIVRVDQDSVIWINDREAPTRQELIARLRDELAPGRGAPQGLLISYHPDARHERIVMCIDVGTLLGVENITRRSSLEGPE
jgi:biopolymer transport protein ExbD